MLDLNKMFKLNKKHILYFILYSYFGNLAHSKEVEFNPDFLTFSDGDNATNFDLSYFSNQGNQIPGNYLVKIFVNGVFVDEKNIDFFMSSKKTLTACISNDNLTEWGIKKTNKGSDLCNDTLDQHIPYAKESLDIAQQRYDITVPQQWLLTQFWRTSPQLWDDGIPSILLNYTYSGFKQNNKNSNFLGLDGGLNFSSWRLRNQSNYNNNSGWQSINTYLQKDYTWGRGGTFTVGETSLNNNLINNFSFSGVKLESDNDMLLPSFYEYGPVIRGVANTDATVYIKQNGNTIYQANVPAGPFSLRNISSYISGDVDVEVHESNGNIKKYTQSFATLPIFQPEGHSSYSVSMGNIKADDLNYKNSKFISASISSGLPNDRTIYGEALIADNYNQGTIGIGQNIHWLGALATDISFSKADIKNKHSKLHNNYGYLYHISYSKNFTYTGTSVIASGFYNPNYRFQFLSDLAKENNLYKDNNIFKKKLQFNINQSLGDSSSLSINSSYDENNKNLMATLNKNINDTYFSLTLNNNRNRYQNDKSAFLSVSIPMTSPIGKGLIYASSLTNYENSRISTQFGLSGATENKKLHWNIHQGIDNRIKENQGSTSLTWNGDKTKVSLGYNYSNSYQRWSYSANGGVAIYPIGITLGPQLSFSGGNALVSTSGISDITIKNGMNKTDLFGNAIVSNLVPYQYNNISIDVDNIPNNIDLNDTDKQIIPKKGSLVKLSFDANTGQRALITLKNKGKNIPTGAKVILIENGISNLFYVGHQGVVYINKLPNEGELKVKWDDNECIANFKLNSEKLNKIQLNCY